MRASVALASISVKEKGDGRSIHTFPQFAFKISVPHEAVVPVYPSSATLKKDPLVAVFASATLAM
jgi:hypothetical protein